MDSVIRQVSGVYYLIPLEGGEYLHLSNPPNLYRDIVVHLGYIMFSSSGVL